MSNVVGLTTPKPANLLEGPFHEWRVVIDGRVVPRLTGTKSHDGRITLCVDNRFGGGPFSADDAYQAAYLIANAMAITAGYSNFSADTQDKPFASRIMRISTDDIR